MTLIISRSSSLYRISRHFRKGIKTSKLGVLAWRVTANEVLSLNILPLEYSTNDYSRARCRARIPKDCHSRPRLGLDGIIHVRLLYGSGTVEVIAAPIFYAHWTESVNLQQKVPCRIFYFYFTQRAWKLAEPEWNADDEGQVFSTNSMNAQWSSVRISHRFVRFSYALSGLCCNFAHFLGPGKRASLLDCSVCFILMEEGLDVRFKAQYLWHPFGLQHGDLIQTFMKL